VPFEQTKSEKVHLSSAPYSLATRTSTANLLHISGQVPNDASGNLVGKGDVAKQTTQVIENIKALVEEQGGSLADICRVGIFLTSRGDLPAVMEIRRKYFKAPYPATTALIVSGLANPDWMIEIEATADLGHARR
jgi:enamine deaminase RidA (YjgF/YER057c/UK114 family)